jgi:phosphoribosyl-AMP cyclohydrolase
VKAIFVDCDADTILLKVEQVGAACHEGYRSCFFRELRAGGVEVVGEKLG